MWTQVTGMLLKTFKKSEDGALLVFFAMCCAAIFLIAALSFDIGRRASTQSELQSFVDNVALAAAGELNGFPGAMQRAQNAAQDLILDDFVIGEGDRDLQGPGDYHIYFYSSLPDDDEDPLPTTEAAGLLDPSNPDHDLLARFVRIAMINDPARGDKRVTVPWVFGRIFSLFSADPLPAELIGAEAVAGYTSLACDVTPVFFCMPPTAEGEDPWDPSENIGQTIRLVAEAGTGGGDWYPGNFAWLDVYDQVPEEDLTDEDGPCAGESGPDLYACLVAGEGAVSLCFENGYLSTMTGRAEGWRPTTLNSFFDMFDAAQMDLEDDPKYPPAPIVTKDYVEGTTCGDGSSSTTTTTTMPLPPDDCFLGLGGSCASYPDAGDRFGNNSWAEARQVYVETNYSTDADSYGTIEPSEIVNGYHVDDPFRPGATNRLDPDITDYPEIPNTGSRWDYYQAEVATSLYTNPLAVYNETAAGTARAGGPMDLIKDIIDPGDDLESPLDDTTLVDRLGTSLPHCSTDTDGDSLASSDPTRRVITAAAVDCEYWSGRDNEFGRNQLNGGSGRFLATYFVELFLLNPARPNGSTRELYAEVVSGALNGGYDNVAPGTFRNLVQLYR